MCDCENKEVSLQALIAILEPNISTRPVQAGEADLKLTLCKRLGARYIPAWRITGGADLIQLAELLYQHNIPVIER